MKKIFTLSAGILLLLTILFTGGCKCPEKKLNLNPTPEKVTVYLRAVNINGEEHLALSHSPGGEEVIDSLVTGVDRGTKIFWKLADSSGIKKVEKIYPVEKERKILKTDPKKVFLSKNFKFIVPGDAEETEEKYAIKYTLENDTANTIDPYIRIPD